MDDGDADGAEEGAMLGAADPGEGAPDGEVLGDCEGGLLAEGALDGLSEFPVGLLLNEGEAEGESEGATDGSALATVGEAEGATLGASEPVAGLGAALGD